MPEETKFQRAVREKREREARQAAAKAEAEKATAFETDLVPEAQYERSDEDVEIDKIIDNIDILDAYRRWCGKSNPQPRVGQTEGIKVSCPKPNHPDKDPSAWINTDKQTWFCGGCQEGGSVTDMAAVIFGIGTKGADFHKLRQKMAEEYGYTFTRTPGSVKPVITAPEPEPTKPQLSVVSDKPDIAGQEVSDSPDSSLEQDSDEADVIEMFDDMDNISWPTLDWRSIVAPDTFLWSYMRATEIDDVAEEYHLWNGLIALGLSLGRDVRLADLLPVYGNLFICTLGHSGSGKSKARGHLDRLLGLALPYDHADIGSKGARRVATPGSAEVLIHNFSKPIIDPSDFKTIIGYAPVRGIVDFNELSALTGRTSRIGNVLKPTLMQLYDVEDRVTTASLTHGTKEAHYPFVSALTTTQPRAVRHLLTQGDADSGFLNRWVFVSGTDKQKIAIGGAIIDVKPPADKLSEVFGWAGTKTRSPIQWSRDAAELFTKFFHSDIEPDKKADSSGLLVRLDLLMKKLILLMNSNQMFDEVQVESVERVIEMYGYLKSCYGILEARVGSTLAQEIHDLVYMYVQMRTDKGKPPSLRDISKNFTRRKWPLDLLIKTIGYMTTLGEIEEFKTTGVGRPTVRYRNVG